MRNFVYSVLAVLVLTHCIVTQVNMQAFCEELYQGHLMPMYTTVQNLASNNTSLNRRIEHARGVVEVVTEENTRLKVSLREGVEMLQEEIEENNKLNEQINNLNWRIRVLLQTIDQISPCKEADDVVVETTES